MGFLDWFKPKTAKQEIEEYNKRNPPHVDTHVEAKAREAHALKNQATSRLLKIQTELKSKGKADSDYLDRVSEEIGSIAATVALATGRVKR